MNDKITSVLRYDEGSITHVYVKTNVYSKYEYIFSIWEKSIDLKNTDLIGLTREEAMELFNQRCLDLILGGTKVETN